MLQFFCFCLLNWLPRAAPFALCREAFGAYVYRTNTAAIRIQEGQPAWYDHPSLILPTISEEQLLEQVGWVIPAAQELQLLQLLIRRGRNCHKVVDIPLTKYVRDLDMARPPGLACAFHQKAAQFDGPILRRRGDNLCTTSGSGLVSQEGLIQDPGLQILS